MKTQFDIEKIIKNGKIENELDFERALIADRKLRILSKESSHYKSLRKKLRDIIEEYEKNQWSDLNLIDENKIKESDLAEFFAEKERAFIERRKTLIKEKLKEININQQEFGFILGHKSKTYTSELINGLSSFTLRDLIIINQLLKIDLSHLVPIFLSNKDQEKVKAAIHELNKPLKLAKGDLIFA